MQTVSNFIAVFAIIALVACARGPKWTPYQPEDDNGGYTDVTIRPGVYYVSFEGNGDTSQSRVTNLLSGALDAIRRGSDPLWLHRGLGIHRRELISTKWPISASRRRVVRIPSA